MLNLSVLVSGGGTNLQAIIDRIRSGDIRLFLAVAACAVLTIVLLILLNRKGFSWFGTLLSFPWTILCQ